MIEERIWPRRVLACCAAFAALPAVAAGQTTHPVADLVVRNARITTLDESRPEAQAVAIEGGRFVAIGDEAAIGP